MIGAAELPPQATSKPNSISDTQRLATAECFHIFRPARPATTMPASGNVNGSHGERFSARRWMLRTFPIPVLGPEVFMISVTVAADDPAGIVADVDAGPPFTL